MKNSVKIFVVLSCLYGVLSAQVDQRITKARYWLNSSTPVNAVEVSPTNYTTDSNTVNFSNISVDVSALSPGLHILYASAKDANGVWGAPKTTSFIVGSITKNRVTKIRYWFNNQTSSSAVEVATTLSYNVDSTVAVLNNISIDVSSLSAGLNRIYVSIQDVNGKWGAPDITSFFIGTITKTYVVKGQYWFNNPVPTGAVDVLPTYIGDSTKVSFANVQIDVSALSEGQHTLYFRTQDNNGKWGTAERTVFSIRSITKNYITKGQYWFDNPSPTNPVDVSPTFLGDSTNVSFSKNSIDVSALSEGQHMLYYRTQDNANKWGSAQATVFSIRSVPKKYITKGQYWFSNQTVADAIDFTPTYVGDSSRVTANLSSVTVPSGLPNGKYSIYIRYQDVNGKWGVPQTIQYVQNAALAPPTIAQMEFFFGNTDPGPNVASAPKSGTITGIGGRTANFSDSFSIDSLGLPLGLNKFSVRFKSDKDEWGPTISGSFSVLTRPEFFTYLSDTLRFGHLYSGRDSEKDSFYIRNKGDADLKVKVGTPPNPDFSIKFGSGQDSVTIAKESFNTDSVKVVVTYAPTKAGKVAGAIIFSTNDSAKSFVAIVPVSATADSAIGKIASSVDTIRFGKVALNATKTLTLVISNVGIDTIQVQNGGVSNYPDYYYFKAQPYGVSKKIGYQSITDTAQYKVSFTPTYEGQFQGSFPVFSYTNETYPQYLETKTIYMEGEGINIQNPTIDVDNSLINFGGVNARAPKADSSERILVLSNLGQNVLTIDSIVSSNKNIFKVVNIDLPLQVFNNNPINTTLRFSPPTGIFQSYEETLTIYNNSTDSNQVVVIPVTGDATDGPPLSVLALSDSVIDFGSVTIGYNLSKNITIRNKGTGVNKSLNVTALSINSGLFTTNQSVPFKVPAGDSITFAVKFAPTSTGIVYGNMSIGTDATTRPVRVVDLQGNGVVTPQPILQTSMSPLTFSPTKLQASNSVYFKFKNAGNATLQTDSIFMAKQTSFFTVNRTKLTLAPNGWDSVLVTFTPLAVLTYTDTLIFLSNLNPSRYGIVVTGKGEVLAIALDTNVTSTNPQVVNGNQPIQIGVSLTASLGTGAVAYLYYRLSGTVTFDSLQMTTSDGIHYQGVIPANKIGNRGAVYYVTVTNGAETITLPQSFVSVAFPSGIQPSDPQPIVLASESNKQKFYRMISVPMDGLNGSVDTVLKNFGAYNKEKWRLYRYQAGQYVEHNQSGFETFAPGRGYWFITTVNGKLQSGSGRTTSASTFFNISLQSEWNQIGNPYTFPVKWSDVTKTNSVGQIFTYNPTTIDYDLATTLTPWEGYFVKNTSPNPTTINIPPKDSSSSGTLPKFAKGGMPVLAENEWLLQIKATDGEISDNSNFIGVKNNASDEYDENDIEESPCQPTEYLKLTFNNNSWSKRPDNYGYDFRHISNEGKYWDFEIHTNSTKELIKCVTENYESIPVSFDIILLDKEAGTSQNIRSKSNWNIRSTKNEMTKHFRIVIGTKEFVEKNSLGIELVPKSYNLSQNYPNPFNPSTTIKYTLPAGSYVTLKMYDILGKEVYTLVNESMPEGYYTIQWNGVNSANEKVASGVYFCRIAAQSLDGLQNYSHTIKMILMK